MPLRVRGIFLWKVYMKKIIRIILLLIFGFCVSYTYYYTHRKPLVSVIITTYNRAHLLPDIFKSIDNSTFKNFEVIFVNDASKDNTKQVLKDYAKYKRNIIIQTNPKNLGMEGSRNKGIQLARGTYLGFMDDDDVFYKDWIEKSVDFLKKNPKIDAVVPMRHNLVTPPTRQNNSPLSQIIYGNVMGFSGIVIKKEFLDKHHIRFHKKFMGAEDYAFWHDVLTNNGIVWRHPDFLVAIRSGSVHSKEHYDNHAKNKKIISNSFKKYYSSDGNLSDLCAIFTNIQKTEKFAQQFDDKEIKTRIHENCRIPRLKEKSKWIFFHPGWSDGIILLNNNTIQRVEFSDEKATIIQISENKITVKWHNYGIETFVCNNHNECQLKK